ncbi:MAG: AMIN-like domain-containing (lipo)protein, partial [Nocardioides sp.]
MRILRFLSLVLIAGLVVPAAPAGSTAAAPAIPTLVGIRAAHHPGFDRVVFDFRGGLPASRRVRYVDHLVADASGLPVP